MVEGSDQQREEKIHKGAQEYGKGCELIYDKRLFFFSGRTKLFLHSGKTYAWENDDFF